MKRRGVLILAVGAVATWPLAGGAQQQPKLPTIGFLGAGTPSGWSRWVDAFEQRMRELGWIEGRTVTIEYRWAEGRDERYREIAAEFVRLKVDIIVTVGGAVLAVKQATSDIPIVFALAADPVGSGLVAGLARPGGNVTGLSIEATDIAGKRLGLLREVVPGLRLLAIMANVGYRAAVLEMNEVQAAARTLGFDKCNSYRRLVGGNVPPLPRRTTARRARFVAGWLFALLAMAAFSGFGAATSQAQERAVNIGVLTDMSGLYKDLSGEGSVEAARMAVEDFGGQVLDTTIQVYAGDHKNDVPTATTIATEWFEKKRVGVIVDMPHSPAAIAMHKLAFERKRIDIAVSSGSTDLTGSACTETGFHWAYDTYSNSVPLTRAMVGFRLNSWFFITVDNAFGLSLEKEATTAIVAAGGRVIGDSRHALNSRNFGSQLAAAQDSGARVIALANAGGDTVNAVKEAAELGISSRSQALAPLLVFITDVHTIGLDIAKGMTFIDGFYWNADPETRAWSKRFLARRGVMPTMSHAGVYSAVKHYLRAVQATGTDDAFTVAAKMRDTPVDDFFAKGGRVRADGRLAHDMYLVQVKQPAQSRQPWDYYEILSTIPRDKAFRPLEDSVCPLVKG